MNILYVSTGPVGVGIGWSGPSWYWRFRGWLLSAGRVGKSFHMTVLGLDLHFHWNR